MTDVGYCKRLIEVDLPIRAVSANARREKSTSTITGLHLWWARRPLAACRAVICASLWPDPADRRCPDAFVSAAAGALRKFASSVATDSAVANVVSETFQTWMSLSRRPKGAIDPIELRELLLKFIAAFADVSVTNIPIFVQTARAITAASTTASDPVQVLDPFAGGGSIPIESVRVGATAIAGDINPVALLINDVFVGRSELLTDKLKETIRRTASEIAQHVCDELKPLYPSDPKLVPITYLFARTVISEEPGGELPVEIPLLRSLWLSKRAGSKIALRWVRDSDGQIICDITDVTYADGSVKRVQRPRLEVFAPSKDRDVEPGTTAGGSATSPITGFVTPKMRVRAQLEPRRGGTTDARMIAVVSRPAVGKGRRYRIPTLEDIEAATTRVDQLWHRVTDPVDQALPGGKVWKNNPFRIQNYGMRSWGDMFTRRQTLVLSLLAERISVVSEKLGGGANGDAVQEILALTLGRLADHLNSCCAWNPVGEKLQHLFARQAVPMVWDFAEANAFGGSVGTWLNMVDGGVDALEFASQSDAHNAVIRASAAESPLPDDSVDAVITDPPYYDAVPYADLSEFFYVWLRKAVPASRAEWFAPRGIDRVPEIVFDGNRAKDANFYVGAMTDALREARRVTKPDGIGVVVFAHKSTAGWEALLNAVVNAGWIVTASWPIDTELGTRVRALNSAALASSVHLVCRPRESTDGRVTEDAIGDWRSVLSDLPRRISEWMPRLAGEGVVGADAIFACLGPALEVFSKYSRVEKANGEIVTLAEYLEHVWAAVAKQALSMVLETAETSGLEPDGRLTAIWLWTLSGGTPATSVDVETSDEAEDDEGATAKKPAASGFTLEFDAARKLAQGLGAHLEELSNLLEVRGDTARLLSVTERARYLFAKGEEEAKNSTRKKKNQQSSLFADLEGLEESESGGSIGMAKPASTTLDRIHQSMILFGAGRGEALKRFLIEEGVGNQPQFWKLAQSLSALYPSGTDEKRWMDGVLARKKSFGFA